MKKNFFIILLCGLYMLGFAQTNDITVFTEKGEAFILFVNSAKQNDVPAANVKAKNISGDSYQFRLQFLDKSIPELTGRFYTAETNVEITMMAKQNNKGKWNLTFRGESPKVIEAQPETDRRQHGSHHDHHRNHESAPTGGNVSMNINDGTENVSINMTVTESGLGIQAGSGQESVNLNMNVLADGITTTTTMTTTTTTTTTSGSSINPAPAPAPAPAPVPVGRCVQSMSNVDFADAKSSIQSQTFEDSKITLAKQVIKNSCMTSDQVRDLLKVFTYEDSRIEIAKYAYDYVFDANKYYKVNDAFQYSSSIDELNRFISR